MNTLSSLIGSEITNKVKKEMKRQKVPRKFLTDGPALEIYKRCGWEPPKMSNEEDELSIRRELVSSNVSSESLKLLDQISTEYERIYMTND